ncbi:DUF4132 domain-containing protein [Jannaschia pohangensis]|nr:DUF4132 domain-containing protein [Jannaschia pohangensis]
MRIAKEIEYLDKVEADLTVKTVSYILTGEPATVIASLDAQSQAILKARAAKIQGGGYVAHYGDPKAAQGRRAFVLDGAQNLDIAARYVKVLALTDFLNVTLYAGGSDDMPDLVKSLIQTVGQVSRAPGNISTTRLSADDLLKLIAMLGGRPADLVDHVMGSSWSVMTAFFRDRDALEQFALSLPATEVIAGLTRHKADTLANAIKAMTWRKIASDPAYLDFLLGGLESGSQKVRDAARAALLTQDAGTVTDRVVPLASSGKAALRTSAAQMLGELGTDTAMDALRARREIEKTQAVQLLIDQFLGTSAVAQTAGVDPAVGYIAADGSTVEIPARRALPKGDGKPFGKDDLAILSAIDAKLEASQREHEANRVKAGHKPHVVRPVKRASDLIDVFNGERPVTPYVNSKNRDAVQISYLPNAYHGWISEALSRAPTDRAMQICLASLHDFDRIFEQWQSTPMTTWIGDRMRDATLDLRDLLNGAGQASIQYRSRDYLIPVKTPAAADFARVWIGGSAQTGSWTAQSLEQSFGKEPCWPAIAEHLDVIADALPPQNLNAQANAGAIAMLQLLPALPAQFVQPILFVALGDSRVARDRARAVLAKQPGLDEAISEALTDKRQAVRANAASFLAQRGAKSALPAIVKRLKAEKSETARAAMISAVADLGGDTTPYLSRKALVAEAEKLATKLPGGKLDWLPLDQAPGLRWRDGATVEPVVIDAWTKLAVKLKAPGDGALFNLYLDQLDKGDAEAFANWLLTSWIGYDTFRDSLAEMRAAVLPMAQQYQSQYTYYKDKPLDEIVAMLVRYQMQSYPNSGSDTKGLLAMTHRATPAVMARICSAYLKDHGKRVSQAKAMIEVLASAGTSESIQVLVATSTRFKQRSVREMAETLVTALAEDRGWTADELADRSIPSGGLEDGGAMELEVGEELKTYTIRLDSDLAVRITNPAGKEVKSLPAGKDAATKEAKSLLSGLKKTIKTVTDQQRMRLYEAMMAGRTWTRDDWQNDLNAHPIMARLTERLVWRALAEDGTPIAAFRPTPEGDLFDAAGDDVDLDAAVRIDLAHSATMDAEARAAWLEHIKDFEVTPLFAQLTRPVHDLTPDQRALTAITDREGWLMEALKLRSATGKLGYDRGSVEDGASFQDYSKTFRSAGIVAELQFTGSYVPEDNIPVAIMSMQFRQKARIMKLGDVPPLLLSECWNDLHDIAAVGSFDADWRKKGLYT